MTRPRRPVVGLGSPICTIHRRERSSSLGPASRGMILPILSKEIRKPWCQEYRDDRRYVNNAPTMGAYPSPGPSVERHPATRLTPVRRTGIITFGVRCGSVTNLVICLVFKNRLSKILSRSYAT
jgi:hypothetical protein